MDLCAELTNNQRGLPLGVGRRVEGQLCGEVDPRTAPLISPYSSNG